VATHFFDHLFNCRTDPERFAATDTLEGLFLFQDYSGRIINPEAWSLAENNARLKKLNIWKRYHGSWKRLKTQNRIRKFCREHFLSFSRMREWVYIHDQVTTILREQKIG